ncbi:MAG: restriction endonuclease subunit R, partial [Oscillospiraceae bacterium]|nr:restriction endonuclease subunit R [Oscillospiraceae bacterium]
NSKLSDKKSKTTNDESAYDLIMKDKERLLSFSEPTRFIFSHSALREGWDNPNVFQICTLKQSSADIRKRQEVGRGLRLCVNQDGVRMDENTLSPSEIHNVNLLTVVASESYDTFARELQSEIAEAVKNRPNKVNLELFKDKFGKQADKIYENLVRNSYVEDGKLTEKYFTDKEKGVIELPPEITEKQEEIIKILDTVYNPEKMLPENGRDTIPVNLRKDKFDSKAFKELWSKINAKSFYTVKFDDNELIENSVRSINENLHITGIYYKTDTGIQAEEISKEDLSAGTAFKKKTAKNSSQHYLSASTSVTYDLIDKLVKSTGLTRNVIFRILSSLGKETLKMFTFNPEEFIIKVTQLIKSEISTAIVEHISYNKLTSTYDDTIFTSPEIKKGKRSNSVQSERSIYDYVVCDSKTEMDFASALEQHIDEVEVYVKLPRGFYINTPIEKYNPDWAIAFYEGKVKHIYFIAETKGTMDSLQLKKIEEAKAHCAKEHFKAITDGNVKYSVVSNYKELFEIVSK